MSYAELVMLPAHTLGSTASFALAETGMSLRQPESHSAIQQAPNPSGGTFLASQVIVC